MPATGTRTSRISCVAYAVDEIASDREDRERDLLREPLVVLLAARDGDADHDVASGSPTRGVIVSDREEGARAGRCLG